MPSVTLQTLWLNLATDLTDYQSFQFMSALGSSPQQNVAINSYAGGRQRAIRTPGTAQQLGATLPACTPGQRAWLEQHAGELMCARDDRGRKFYGLYTSPSTAEHQYNDEADVDITINEVTVTEVV